MARFGEQVGGVPESLGPTKRGGRGGSVAVVARRRDELGWAGQGGGHREICFPAEVKRETTTQSRGESFVGPLERSHTGQRTDPPEAVGRGRSCVFVGVVSCKNSQTESESFARS